MLNLKEDTRCISVEKFLIDYAQSVLNREQSRRDFYAKGGKRYDLERDSIYVANCEKCSRCMNQFVNAFDSYINSFGNIEDRMQINGHFLFAYKKLYQYIPPTLEEQKAGKKILLKGQSKDFLHAGIKLAERAINCYPLRAIDKIRFLEHVIYNNFHKEIRGNKEARMESYAIEKLAMFNPHAIKEDDFVKLYDKTVEHISKKSKNCSKEIALFFRMFEHFEKKVVVVTDDTVVKYADLYFMMSDKSKNDLDIAVLGSLANKTMRAVNRAKVCHEGKVLDKSIIKRIFNAYVKHVNSSNGFNNSLARQMVRLAGLSFASANYSVADVKEITNILKNAKLTGKEKNEKEQGLANLSVHIENVSKDYKYIYNNLLSKGYSLYQELESDSVSRQNKFDYAIAVIRKAKEETKMPYNDDIVISEEPYCVVNNENTFAKRRPLFEVKDNFSDLIDVLVKDDKADKELVLDVVGAYVDSYTAKELDVGFYNHSFHEKMTAMLQYIVTECDYTDKEVSELTRRIAKGAEKSYEVSIGANDYEEYGMEAAYSETHGHEVFQDMALSVALAYTQIGDNSYRRDSLGTKAMSPIVLQKTGGGNSGN